MNTKHALYEGFFLRTNVRKAAHAFQTANPDCHRGDGWWRACWWLQPLVQGQQLHFPIEQNENLKNNGELEVGEKESNRFGLQTSVTCYQISIVPFLTELIHHLVNIFIFK